MNIGNKSLALMADLDENTQKVMSGWYKALQEAGFKGVQTPDLPYHITMAALPLVVKSFTPLLGKVTRLHLCEFQPKREIASFDLKNTI